MAQEPQVMLSNDARQFLIELNLESSASENVNTTQDMIATKKRGKIKVKYPLFLVNYCS